MIINSGTNISAHINDDALNRNHGPTECGVYTERQLQSAFCTSTIIDPQQVMISAVQQQQQPAIVQSESPNLIQQYPGEIVTCLPLSVDPSMISMSCTQAPATLQEQIVNSGEYASGNQQYDPYLSNVSSTIINLQGKALIEGTIGNDSSSSSINVNLNQTTEPPNQSTLEIDGGEHETTPFIYDLKKYKYNYFLSKLSCAFEQNEVRFGAPKGLCTLNDDRLLVANFSTNSLLLIDLNGIVHQIFKDLPSPKDVVYYSSNPSQAIVATRKELIILDLNTRQIVEKSNLTGFYPWNIQYIAASNTIAACDPSSERIVYFDKNLKNIGELSFKKQHQQISDQSQSTVHDKVYPYAAYHLPDNTSFVLTFCKDRFEFDQLVDNQRKPNSLNLPINTKSYAFYVDGASRCLLPDAVNHRLLSIDKNSIVEEYKCDSVREPYAISFLSTGTMCITDHSTSYGTNGGISIISETDLKNNQ
ncbi:unnamed protein product [Rotaria magnacalcarata]|uniref:Uncharacterized protein n=1 Tax=Rotaria magnacalcarata TaxID=392030 RepID=A0A814EAS6_9BILA|nr:unnamed protein product [Rotaria magnacalcarata]